MMDRKEVYEVIDGERDYQDSLGPDRTRDPGNVHRLVQGEDLVLIRHYLRKAEDAWTMSGGEMVPAALHEVRKIAAICVRQMEKYGAPKR